MSVFLPNTSVASQLLHCGIRTAVVAGCFYPKALPSEARVFGAALLVSSTVYGIISLVANKSNPEIEKKFYRSENPNWGHRIKRLGQIALFSNSTTAIVDALFWTVVARVGPYKLPLPLLIIGYGAIQSRALWLASSCHQEALERAQRLNGQEMNQHFRESLKRFRTLNDQDFSNDFERQNLIAFRHQMRIGGLSYFKNTLLTAGTILVGRASLIAASRLQR